MNRIIYIFFAFFIFSCDRESGWDCLQTSGNLVQKEIIVEGFQKILVNRDIELIVKQGAFQVFIETGENIVNDVEVKIVGNQLQLIDNNLCNLVRDYGITRIFVTLPNLTEIRNSSQYEVSSSGILSFDELTLISEDYNIPGNFTVGDFRLNVISNKLQIISNNISSFYISGQTNNLEVGFFGGAGRFEGESLIAQYVEIFHRGSNDMIVNPQLSLTGSLRGTGDLIAVNQPPIVEVEQFYTGQLIFD